MKYKEYFSIISRKRVVSKTFLVLSYHVTGRLFLMMINYLLMVLYNNSYFSSS